MKKLSIVLAAFTVFACTDEPKAEYVLLSGSVENPNGDRLMVMGGDFKKDIMLDENGMFSDTLEVEDGYYTFYHGRARSKFYVNQGDSLHISVNAKDFNNSLTYSGTDNGNNLYLAEKNKGNDALNFQEVYTSEEDAFLKTIEDKRKDAEAKLKNAKDLDAEFVAMEEKAINYEYLANLSRYPRYHAYYAKKENFEPSEGFLKPLEGLDYDNAKDFDSYEAYQNLAMDYYMNKAIVDSTMMEAVNEIKELKSQNIKNNLAQQLAYMLSPSNKNMDELHAAIIEISDEEEFKEKINEKYEKIQSLVEGKPSPKFDYENHKGGKTTLADLKGKYVYIDVWATWCGPCIAEIPSLKKVEKKYHDNNIEFVSISIDEKNAYDKWRKMVEDRELGGTQLIADNAWKSKFVTDYAIEGIPRFILIDPDGNIVTADAPRPSNPKLTELFDELKI